MSCRSTTDAQIVRPYSSRFGESVVSKVTELYVLSLYNGRTDRASLQ